MKQLISTLSFAFIFFLGAFSQPINQPEISLSKSTHDFGKVEKNGNAITEFSFTNSGTAPLIISNCKESCGCTIPSWPRGPIAPGETGTIKVKYDSRRIGPFNKSVTITSNATNYPTLVIRITGIIEAPLKSSN